MMKQVMDRLLDNVSHVIFDNRYKIIRKLGEGASSVVYAGESLKNSNEQVAIKILKTAGISHRPENFIRFYNETKLLSSFTHHRIIRLYEAGEKNRMLYMILEYFHGVSIDTLCKQVRTLTLQTILTVMINLCEGLDYIHGKNIVHRDLKPGNILIKEADGAFDFNTLKIIDFGLSQVKKPAWPAYKELTGTLAYLAPEQIGLSAAESDTRSDLYALGVIFYELVTGSLPITGNSAGTFIYRQITSTPDLPSKRNRELPPVLDKIILKLLEKEPGKRYRSARGLIKDLERVRRGVFSFTPDAEDIINRFEYITPLVGRKEEYRDLVHLIAKAQRGKGSICFMKGEPGIGKSRLADECRQLVSDKGGTFIEAGQHSGNNSTPWESFKRALDYYTKIFFRYTREDKQAIRTSMRAKLGDSGRSIVEIHPPCAEIIGDFPPLPRSEQQTHAMRFIRALSGFFLHLSRLEGMLFLVIDDLQWLDAGTLMILNEISRAIAGFPFVIACLYRDREAAENSASVNFINNAAKQSNVFTELKLKPFSPGETAAFIAQIFHAQVQETAALSELLYGRSKGNPLFIVEWIKSLSNAQILFFQDGSWHVNRQQFAGLEIPGKLLALLLERAGILNTRDTGILALAAVIGKRFTMKFLRAMKESPACVPELRTAVISGVMEQAVDCLLLTREEDSQVKGTFRFAHDRIREFFYNRIENGDLLRLHDLAGSLWETQYKEEEPGALFQLLDHYIKAHNKQKILQYSFAAGIKAKEDNAPGKAAWYFHLYKRLLEQSGLYGTPVWIRCSWHLGELYLLRGRSNKALKLYTQLMPFMKADSGQAAVYLKLGQVYYKKGDYSLYENYAEKGLALLGCKLVPDKKNVYLQLFLEIIEYIKNRLFTFVLAGTKNPGPVKKNKLIPRFFYSLSRMYLFPDVLKSVYTALHALNYCIRHPGLIQEYGICLGGLGSVFMSIFRHKPAQVWLKQAQRLNAKGHDAWGKGQALLLTGVQCQWNGEYGKSNFYLRQGLDIMRTTGDDREIQYAVRNLCSNYWYLGLYAKASASIRENPDPYTAHDTAVACVVMNCEMGNYLEAEKCLNRLDYSSRACEENFGFFEKYACTGLVRFYKQEIDIALEFFHKAYAVYKKSNFLMQYSVYIYIFLCEGYLAGCRQQQKNSNHAELSGILRKLAHFSRCAVRKTRAWPTYYGSALRVRAQYWAVKRKSGKAELFFKKSLAHSRCTGRKFELGLGHYYYGYFLHESGKSADALLNWYEAYTLFKEIGAGEFLEKTGAALGCTGNEDVFRQAARERRDEQAVCALKEINSLLGANKPAAEVLDRILAVCMELIGAQRGVILIRDLKSNDLEIFHGKSVCAAALNMDELSIGIIRDALLSREPVVSADALADERMNQYQSVQLTGIRFVLCFPVCYCGALRYLCYFDNLLAPVIIDKARINFLPAVMTLAAAFIGNRFPVAAEHKPPADRTHRIDAFCGEYALTNREYMLLLYILQGLGNREIMNKMNITHNTLHTHLNHIYRKTEAKSREELIKLFLEK